MVTVVKMRREYCVINVLQFSKFFVISFVEPAPSVFMTIWAIFTQADDEHSDWPGPEPGLSVMQLTDEEIDPEISFSQVLTLSFFSKCDSVGPLFEKLENHHPLEKYTSRTTLPKDFWIKDFYFTATCRPTTKKIPGKAGSLWYEAVEKSGNCR